MSASTIARFARSVTPTSDSDAPDLLVDTSVAVALVVADHVAHGETTEALAGQRLGLAGHAAFETYSVLTRLPPPSRRPPAIVARIIKTNFPHPRFLSPRAALELLETLAGSGVAGGAVYDALVGATAAELGVALATRDQRALPTYRRLGADARLLG